tara:strand:+ start:1779 stop:2078 length:300 start_codon:yes stop_codon:yes gene_type:complete
MKDKLNTCINLLTKARELVSGEKVDIELALEMLEKSQDILAEFDAIDNDDKPQYKPELMQIQALGQMINTKLAQEKDSLQEKILLNSKMNRAVRGYSRG